MASSDNSGPFIKSELNAGTPFKVNIYNYSSTELVLYSLAEEKFEISYTWIIIFYYVRLSLAICRRRTEKYIRRSYISMIYAV